MKNKTKKNVQQKSFFFEDYTESEIIINNKNIRSIKVSSNKITFLFFVFLSFIIIFSIKIIYLSLSPDKSFFSEKNNQNFLKERGDIIDKNGIIIARNIDIYSAGIRPTLIKDKEKFLIKLRLIFPDLKTNEITPDFFRFLLGPPEGGRILPKSTKTVCILQKF